MELHYLVFIVFGFFASLISSVFGLGTALVVLSVGAYILPVKEMLALATVLFASSTILKTVLFRQAIEWRIAIILAVASFPFAFIGASLVAEFSSELLRRLLGLMIAVYLLLTQFNLLPPFKLNTPGLVAGSAAYGFVSGLLGSGNIIKAVLFKELNFSKEAFVGAMAATSVLANVAKITAFTDNGLLNSGLAIPILGLIVAGGLAVLSGRLFLMKLSYKQFEIGLRIVLLISALGLMLEI